MVVLHVKKGDKSLFLYKTTLNNLVEDTIEEIITIHNGCLKIDRICSGIEDLCKYGTVLPEEDDPIEKKRVRRNGKRPIEEMCDVLTKSISEAKGIVSEEQIKSGVCLTQQHIIDALSILQGAITIVFPENIPHHDPIRTELENREDLTGTKEAEKVLQSAITMLWFAGKEVQQGKKLQEYFGRNEKTKVVVKIQKQGHGVPTREPVMSEEERKSIMIAEFKRREELRKLENDDDNSYLDSKWADNHHLKKSFHGVQDVTWRPH